MWLNRRPSNQIWGLHSVGCLFGETLGPPSADVDVWWSSSLVPDDSSMNSAATDWNEAHAAVIEFLFQIKCSELTLNAAVCCLIVFLIVVFNKVFFLMSGCGETLSQSLQTSLIVHLQRRNRKTGHCFSITNALQHWECFRNSFIVLWTLKEQKLYSCQRYELQFWMF